MLELIGKIVNHKTFGDGVIKDFDDDHVVVLFNMEAVERKFQYPDAFDNFLFMNDKEQMKKINKAKNEIIVKEEKKRLKLEEARTANNLALEKAKEKKPRKSTATSSKTKKKTLTVK